MKNGLVDRVRRSIDRWSMLRRNDNVLCCVSGGPDSMTLLRVLDTLRSEYPLKLQALHLNYGLRGEESDLDEELVKSVCTSLGIPLELSRVGSEEFRDLPGLSLQEAARDIRYEKAISVAHKTNCRVIALGHNADDQVETFLQRLVRGAGLKGLSAIKPSREHFFEADGVVLEFRIIRPLIEVWRSEIIDFCQRMNYGYRIDKTNLGIDFERNRIRNNLIPVLESYNPRIKESIAKTVMIIRQDVEVLDEMIDEIFSEVAQIEGEVVSINLVRLSELSDAIMSELFRKAILFVKKDLKGIETSHIETIRDLIASTQGTKRVSFKSVAVVREYDRLVFSRQKKGERVIERTVPEPGKVEIGEIASEMVIEEIEKKEAKYSKDVNVAYIDAEKLSFPLKIRSREKGDRFIPLGMDEEKKLHDFFVDEKVPQLQRDLIPIVESQGKIVWVAGHRIDKRFKIDEHTTRVYRLELFKQGRS